MNIDELISKYLDGELSDHEDVLLRAEMSKDPLKKTDFDDAIFMHYSLRADAKALKVPEDVKRNTQDFVLMKIMNEQPTILKLQKRRRIVERLSYSVAAVLIFGFALISEFPAMKHYNQLYTYQAKELIKESAQSDNSLTKSETSNNKFATKSANSASKNNRNNSEKANTPVINNAIANSVVNMSEAKEAFKLLAPKSEIDQEQATSMAYSELDTSDKNIISTDSDKDNLDAGKKEINTHRLAEAIDLAKEIKNDAEANNQSNQSIVRSSNAFSQSFSGDLKSEQMRYTGAENNFEQYAEMQTMNPGIELITSYGGTMMNNVFNDKVSKFSIGFSQSFGYRINEVHKFGFEFGSMNYTSFENSMVRIPLNSSGLESIVDLQQQYNNDPGPTVLVQVQSKKEGHTVWGSVFYEYRALDLDWFSLDARLGLGGSKDGLMNIDRVTGSIDLYRGFKLSVGLDSRFFYTNIPKSYSGTSRLVGAFSLIYGVQITF